MANSSFPLGYISQGSSSSALAIKKTITQANTFVTGDVLYHNGSAYAKAQANVFSTAAVVGVVESATASDFVLVTAGDISLSGLTAGSIHYLDASTPGTLTTTEPAISVPVLIAVSTTLAWIIIDQPESTGTTYAVDSGAADAYAVTLSPAPTAYTTGMKVYFKATNSNTGASTINVNSLGAKNIFYKGAAISIADVIRDDSIVALVYDGTQFHIIDNEVTAGTVTSLTVSGGAETTTGSPITASGTIRTCRLVNAQTGTSDTIADDDRGKLITYSNTSAIAVTLPQAGAASTFLTGWYCEVFNNNSGIVTITPTTSTINGAATLVLHKGQGALIASDGTNYSAQVSPCPTKLAMLTAQVDTTNTSLTDITGLSFSVAANENWSFEAWLRIDRTNGTSQRFSVTAPTGTFSAETFGCIASSTAYDVEPFSSSGGGASKAFNTGDDGAAFVVIRGSIQATAAGNVQLQHHVATAGTSSILNGSWLRGVRV